MKELLTSMILTFCLMTALGGIIFHLNPMEFDEKETYYSVNSHRAVETSTAPTPKTKSNLRRGLKPLSECLAAENAALTYAATFNLTNPVASCLDLGRSLWTCQLTSKNRETRLLSCDSQHCKERKHIKLDLTHPGLSCRSH